jgi:hypothetical protein
MPCVHHTLHSARIDIYLLAVAVPLRYTSSHAVPLRCTSSHAVPLRCTSSHRGFTDRYTWITNRPPHVGKDKKPLPFAADYSAKPAVTAMLKVLANATATATATAIATAPSPPV